jgi:hypothetical protein
LNESAADIAGHGILPELKLSKRNDRGTKL